LLHIHENRPGVMNQINQIFAEEGINIAAQFLQTNIDIGYVVIINNEHTGVLHHNEIYRDITVGDKFKGFIKKIYSDNRVDVAAGKSGFKRVEDEGEKIIRLLKENNDYLPYYDKSDPDDIYSFFSMSKKTFKMTIGNLYKQKLISLEKTGIKLV
nr:RNA-binding protein [Ferruginibacter sp.]